MKASLTNCGRHFEIKAPKYSSEPLHIILYKDRFSSQISNSLTGILYPNSIDYSTISIKRYNTYLEFEFHRRQL